MNKYKTLISVLVIGIFIFSIYELVELNNKKPQPKQWTTEQKNFMILGCIKSSKFLSTTDSTTAKEICSCAIAKLINKYTYDEIWKLDEEAKENKEKVANLFEPLLQECIEPFLKDIKK